MQIGKKYRGKLENVHTQYIDDRMNTGNIDMQRIMIAHTGLSDERVELIVKYIKKNYKFKEIFVGTCGCVVASHGAQNAMSIGLLHK